MSSQQHSTTPARSLDKSIVRDPETGDFAMYLDGDLVGYARTKYEAEDTLDELVYGLLTHDLQPVVADAELVPDPAAWEAASAWDEPCQDCGRIDCDGLCAQTEEPPYCPICGGECEGHDDDDVPATREEALARGLPVYDPDGARFRGWSWQGNRAELAAYVAQLRGKVA